MPKHHPLTFSEAISQSWRTHVRRQSSLPRAQLKQMPVKIIANCAVLESVRPPSLGVFSAPATCVNGTRAQPMVVDDPISDSESWDWGSDFDTEASDTDSDGTFDLHTRQIALREIEWSTVRFAPASSNPPPPPPRQRPASQLSPTTVPTATSLLHSTFQPDKKES